MLTPLIQPWLHPSVTSFVSQATLTQSHSSRRLQRKEECSNPQESLLNRKQKNKREHEQGRECGRRACRPMTASSQIDHSAKPTSPTVRPLYVRRHKSAARATSLYLCADRCTRQLETSKATHAVKHILCPSGVHTHTHAQRGREREREETVREAAGTEGPPRSKKE